MKLWAERAWINGAWQCHVLLEIEGARWSRVEVDVAPAPSDAVCLPGPVLPGLVNAHSHAFQRAFAGLAERREHAQDDFWSWRDRMYGIANRITPAQLQAVAAQLYAELLQGGYTQVCEFHYLHHTESGAPYGDLAAMAHALVEAADETGIGLTLLPVLYERAGFTQSALRDEQRRFATTAVSVLDIARAVRADVRINTGVAIHSLRAASGESIRQLMAKVHDVPVHIHVAEQTAEVDACLQALGARPIEWLCRELHPDARWQLVHATHATPAEIDAVAACGAGIVMCPTTEANLGDGVPDLRRWLSAGVPLSIGSDSQVSRQANEELRWLEYAQRLMLGQRNVAAEPSWGQLSTAARLFDAVQAAGGAACGLSAWGLKVGARADLCVVDLRASGMVGVPDTHVLDAWVFGAAGAAVREVWVAGQCVVRDGRHVHASIVAERFSQAPLDSSC